MLGDQGILDNYGEEDEYAGKAIPRLLWDNASSEGRELNLDKNHCNAVAPMAQALEVVYYAQWGVNVLHRAYKIGSTLDRHDAEDGETVRAHNCLVSRPPARPTRGAP